MLFSSRFSLLSHHLRSWSGSEQESLHALSDCIDLATSDLEIELLRKAATMLPSRSLFKGQGSYREIVDRMLRHETIRIIFVNDNGVYAGAGIGLKRQAQSFARAGHHVSIIALNGHDPAVQTFREDFGNWCAEQQLPIEFLIAPSHELPLNKSGQTLYADFLVNFAARHSDPALIVFGNLHSCSISPSLITRLMAAGYPCVLYAHDLDWITGGCAYPQYYHCTRYKTPGGCRDSECPMPQDAYPMSSWRLKKQNYAFRSVILGTGLVPILTNSDWTTQLFRERFPFLPRTSTVMLGTDTDLFQPSLETRKMMRERLGIADAALVVAVGADNNSRPGKGGDEVQHVIAMMADREDLVFLAVGHTELAGENVINLGYQPWESQMAEVFQCADLFLNMATIDCFGQVSIEAAACGCVPLVLRGTGTTHAIQNMTNGILVADKQEVISTIDRLLLDRDSLAALAISTQRYTSEYFSLDQQYVRWLTTLIQDVQTPQKLTTA